MLQHDFMSEVYSDSTMAAYPLNIVEQEVRHFVYQWRLGLQPALSMYTQLNGAITISTCVASFPPQLNQVPPKRKRCSGRKARMRRKKMREGAQTNLNVAPLYEVQDQDVSAVKDQDDEEQMSMLSERYQSAGDSTLDYEKQRDGCVATNLENGNSDLLIDLSSENYDCLDLNSASSTSMSVDVQREMDLSTLSQNCYQLPLHINTEALIPPHGPDLNGWPALQPSISPQMIPSQYESQMYATLKYFTSRT